MITLQIGDQRTARATVRDTDAQLVDAADALFEVSAPQRADVVDNAPAHPSVGIYTKAVTFNRPGLWEIRFRSENPDTGATIRVRVEHPA